MTDDDVNGLFPARADSLSAPLPLVLTVEQAAARLGVGRTVMYALVSSGAVESVQIGRLRRVPADALVTFLDELRAGAEVAWRDTPSQRPLNDLPRKRRLLARSGDRRSYRSRGARSATCHVTLQVRGRRQSAGAGEETGDWKRSATGHPVDRCRLARALAREYRSTDDPAEQL